MTVIGMKLEEVFLPQKKEKIVKVSDGGTPSGGGTLTLYVQGNILDQTASNKATLRL